MKKIPCEIIVWYVLPVIRKGLASEMLKIDGATRKEVASALGVTPSAISQYMKNKRSKDFCDIIEDKKSYETVMKLIEHSAKKIYSEQSKTETEICKICNEIRKLQLLNDFYPNVDGELNCSGGYES